MMEHDRRRQKELRCGQRPGSIVVAEDFEEEVPGDADGTASSMPNPCAVRELGHCLAAAGLVDLGLLLPTVCGDAVGAADILRAAAPQGYDRYDAYASGLLRFVLGPTPGHTGKPAAGSTTTTVEAERQVMIFLDRLTESSLPTTCGPGHPRTPTDTDSR